jgi:glutaredoxin
MSMTIVVFSKSYCPYCKASKALLSEKGAKYFLMELDQVGMLPSHSIYPPKLP